MQPKEFLILNIAHKNCNLRYYIFKLQIMNMRWQWIGYRYYHIFNKALFPKYQISDNNVVDY